MLAVYYFGSRINELEGNFITLSPVVQIFRASKMLNYRSVTTVQTTNVISGNHNAF